MELIETSTFTKQIDNLLSDDEYSEFQTRLAANPQLGALIKHGGGIRKVPRCGSFVRQARRCPRHLLLGGPKKRDLAALCVSQECGGRFDSEAGFPTCQSCQRGVRR